MILINVKCVELNRIFDFRVDEHARISRILEDMTEVIGKYAHLGGVSPDAAFVLCDEKRGVRLEGASTLAESRVEAGDTLTLI